MPIVLKSGSLNLLEPSGPVQACNGIALPLVYLLGLEEATFASLRVTVPCLNGGKIELWNVKNVQCD